MPHDLRLDAPFRAVEKLHLFDNFCSYLLDMILACIAFPSVVKTINGELVSNIEDQNGRKFQRMLDLDKGRILFASEFNEVFGTIPGARKESLSDLRAKSRKHSKYLRASITTERTTFSMKEACFQDFRASRSSLLHFISYGANYLKVIL